MRFSRNVVAVNLVLQVLDSLFVEVYQHNNGPEKVLFQISGGLHTQLGGETHPRVAAKRQKA